MSSLLLGIISICIFAYFFNRWFRKQFVDDFTWKAVFITGTDSGFGKKLALELDLKGLTVFAGCFLQESVQKLSQEASSRMKICKIDVTNRDSIQRAKEFVQQNLNPNQGLWAIVNNAGISKGTLFEFATVKDYREVMDVNFFGAVEVNEIFLPLIKKARGRIVNLVSIMGRCSLTAGPYSASKFAMESYSDGLRRTLRPFGIRVSIIEPGFFKTSITDYDTWGKDLDRQWSNLPAELKEQYGEKFFNGVQEALREFSAQPTLSNFNTLDQVTGSITHAIGAKHPKDRYVVGLDGHIIYRPLSLLPDWAMDFFIYVRSRHVYNCIVKK